MRLSNLRYIPNSLPAQAGMSLFMVMIGILIMSLAALAMIRSVDTDTLIVGNVGFKKTVSSSKSIAIEAVADSLATISIAASFNNDRSKGYYARCNEFDESVACDGRLLLNPETWDASSVKANSISAEVINGIDRNGNTISYVVERMCNLAPTQLGSQANPVFCQMSVGSIIDDNQGCSKGAVASNSGLSLECANQQTPLYRATIKIDGPKGTSSIFQVILS